MNSLWHRFNSWLHSIIRRGRVETEMDEEIRFHLEARAADLMREGLDLQSALRRARLEFGGVASHKDRMRHSLGLRWWDELWGDFRYASRILRKSPGFTAIAVGSLALAIGANTTIYSVANELLYERLGVPHPEQLRLLQLTGDEHLAPHMSWGENRELPNGRPVWDSFTYPIYQQLRSQNSVLGDIFAFKDIGRVNVTVDGNAQAAIAQLVSGNFYQQMQVQPALGRGILPSDDSAPGTGAVVVISDSFWSRNFARSPHVIGKVITVNTAQITIVGVNPKGFTGAESVQESPDFFIPLSMVPLLRAPLGDSGPLLTSRKLWWVQLMARAKPGVSDEQARASLDVAVNAATRATTDVAKNETVPHIVLSDGSKGLNDSGEQYSDPLYVLLAMVGGVLLLACANMANLMLARASARQREMSVRLALGAGRWRILRQVLAESLMLSCLGGALGLVLGYFGRTSFARLTESGWDTSEMNVPFNWKVFLFTAGITVGTGILFGILPAWRSTRAEIGAALKQGSQTASRRRKAWSGKAIVAFQVALSTLLVAAAGLFLQTLVKLDHVDPGFRTDHLVLFDISPSNQEYPAPKDVALHARMEDALRAVPGVEGVTASDIPLLAGADMNGGFTVEGAPKEKTADDSADRYPYLANVGNDFVSIMKLKMLDGRAFNAHDTATSQRVAIVNQKIASKYFPNQNPIGRRFSAADPGDKDPAWTTIIGVFADIRYSSLRKDPPLLHFDLYRQQESAGNLTYIIRTRLKPEAIVPSLRAAVQRIDPNLPLMDIRTEDEQIAEGLQQERMFAALTSGFGILALGLACVGIYGIMAYTVSQRTNEIGIRLALGAERGRVRGLVLREAIWLSLIGVVSGLAVALALGRLVKSMLYGLQPADPVSLAGSALLLITVALLAGWIPAMRASRVEPMVALRHE